MENNDDYRDLIIELVGKIDNSELLKRIYTLVSYLYINKKVGK